jgi:peptide/nickel transport system substrate-binding protein
MKKVVLALAAVLAASGIAQAQTPRDTLVVGWKFDDILSLDPHESFEFAGSEFGSQVYDKLITFDPQNIGPIKPGVAESWTVSADGKVITFKIRQGIKFHSGNPLTAEDVEYSVHRAVTMNKSPAFIITQFGLNKDNVKQRARATDASTFVLETDKAYATSFVLNCLSANVSAVIDSKLVKSNEKDGDWGNTWLKTNSAGSGAFKLTQWRANETLSYERNDNYWQGAPKIRRVVGRYMADANTRRLALEKGGRDVGRALQSDQMKALQNNANIQTRSVRKAYIWYLGLSTKHEHLKKPQVQQALKYLIDYDQVANTVLAGAYANQQTIIPQGFLGSIDDKPFKLDVARAKQLLAEAGVPNGFSVTMDVTNTYPSPEIAQAIQATFAQAGVKLELIPGDFRATLTKYRARNHDIYVGRWGSDFLDPHSNADAFAKNVNNADDAPAKPLAWRNSWQDKELSDMVEAAMIERDTEKRKQIYENLQRKLTTNSPFVVAFQNTELVAERKNVKGLAIGPISETTFFRLVEKN